MLTQPIQSGPWPPATVAAAPQLVVVVDVLPSPATDMAVMAAALKFVPPVPMVSSTPAVGGSERAMSRSAEDVHPAAPEITS